MDQGEASWAEIADGTLCGQDPDEIGVPARWPLDGTEDEQNEENRLQVGSEVG
ncbi:hypothetical protein HDV57DRAFT_517837 [Trichoderma longibrachiatum]